MAAVYDGSNGYVYVTNWNPADSRSSNNSDVTVLSGTTVVASVRVGQNPCIPAYDSRNGYVYVPNFGSGNLSVINGTKVVATLDMGGPGANPLSATFDEGNGFVYVVIGFPAYNAGAVAVVNGTRVIASMGVGDDPRPATYDVGNGYFYVPSFYNGTLSVIRGTSVVAKLDMGPPVPPFYGQEVGPSSATYDSANGYVYVTDYYSGNVSVVDGTKYVATVRVWGNPNSAAYDSGNGYIYVSNNGSGSVDIINGTSLVGSVGVGQNSPGFACYDRGNGFIYVPNSDSDNVSVINGSSQIGSVPVGSGPDWAVYDPGNDIVLITNSYSTNVTAIPSAYPVNVAESGLPLGIGWWVNSSGVTSAYSTAPTLILYAPTGNYTLSVSAEDKTYASAGGSFLVNRSPTSTSVDFLRVTYPVAMSETGLLIGSALWSVRFQGTLYGSATASLGLPREPNGTYPFLVGTVPGYNALPRSGVIRVNGAAANQTINFSLLPPPTYELTFTESGLPNGTEWWINTTDGISTSSSTGVLSFNESNGTIAYGVSASNKNYSASGGSVTVAGGPTFENLTFARATYTVSFLEAGLPSGVGWAVMFGGVSRFGSRTISFSGIPNGTYDFIVEAPADYTANPVAGTISVEGPPISPSIAFNASVQRSGSSSPRFLYLPPIEGYSVLGGVILAILLGTGGLTLWKRRGNHLAPPPGLLPLPRSGQRALPPQERWGRERWSH